MHGGGIVYDRSEKHERQSFLFSLAVIWLVLHAPEKVISRQPTNLLLEKSQPRLKIAVGRAYRRSLPRRPHEIDGSMFEVEVVPCEKTDPRHLDLIINEVFVIA
jgi:hypothetical protein